MKNWIKRTGNPEPSSMDKLKALLKIPHKLLLIHFQELEKIKRQNKSSPDFDDYIGRLYKHYIEKELSKQQLKN
jgi:hypothetical protein